MSVHTYIGARYVPRFLGTYDPTQQYEALDVVDNGSGTSYIAKNIVPAGTPLTDITHWAVYGAASGAIIALQNDMLQAQNDILGLQSDIGDLDDKIDDTRLNLGRRVYCIADSYGSQPSATESWTYYIQNYLDADYFRSVKEDAMGFYRTGVNGHNASTLLDDDYPNITDPDTITDVIVVLGINDYYEALADVNTGIQAFIANALSKFPNATIYLGNAGYKQSLTRTEKVHLCDIIKSIYAYAGRDPRTKPLTGIECIMHDVDMVSADGLHPNLYGSGQIANAVATIVNGGQYCYKHTKETTLTYTDGTTATVFQIMDGYQTSVVVRDALGVPSAEAYSDALVQAGTLGGPLVINNTYLENILLWDSANSKMRHGQVTFNKDQYLLRVLDGNGTFAVKKFSVNYSMPTLMV